VITKIIRHVRQGTLVTALHLRIVKSLKNYRLVLKDLIGASKSNIYHGEIAAGYLDKRAHSRKWQAEQEIMQELLNQLPNGISVLDVPFGTGRFVRMYLNKKMSVTGIDISPDMISAAKKALGKDYLKCEISVGSADSLPFERERFDLVVCCRFISMLPLQTAEKVLSEFHRVSREKLIIYMNVRKPHADLSMRIEQIWMLFSGRPRYKNRLGGNMEEKAFLELLESCGFSIRDRRVIVDLPKSTYLFYLLDKQSARH
jgi:ubiquinone/menaquinone biosynthesis C-methylase UbiE